MEVKIGLPERTAYVFDTSVSYADSFIKGMFTAWRKWGDSKNLIKMNLSYEQLIRLFLELYKKNISRITQQTINDEMGKHSSELFDISHDEAVAYFGEEIATEELSKVYKRISLKMSEVVESSLGFNVEDSDICSKKENMEFIDAICSCREGCFVSNVSLEDFESMHMYEGKLYFEDGSYLDQQPEVAQMWGKWILNGWYIKFTPEQVNATQLAKMHIESKGFLLNNDSYEDCIIHTKKVGRDK